jgi:hypothetical protein
MRTLHIFVALCLAPTAIATAQSRSAEWPLDSGSRVRIHAPIFSEKTQLGTVVRTQGDTLHFRACCGTTSTAVGVQDITRMDVFQGTHSRKMKGGLIGFAIGGGLAAGIAAATWKPSTSLALDFGRRRRYGVCRSVWRSRWRAGRALGRRSANGYLGACEAAESVNVGARFAQAGAAMVTRLCSMR